MGRVRVSAIVGVAAASLVFAAAAGSAGAPAMLGRVSLKPLPKTGAVAFYVVTVKGSLKSGVSKPSALYLELSGSTVSAGTAVGVVEPPAVVAHGKATASFLVAVDRTAKKKNARRLSAAAFGGDALDFIVIGAANEWGPDTTTGESTTPCAKFKKRFKEVSRMIWDQFYLSSSPKTKITGHDIVEWAIQNAEADVGGC